MSAKRPGGFRQSYSTTKSGLTQYNLYLLAWRQHIVTVEDICFRPNTKQIVCDGCEKSIGCYCTGRTRSRLLRCTYPHCLKVCTNMPTLKMRCLARQYADPPTGRLSNVTNHDMASSLSVQLIMFFVCLTNQAGDMMFSCFLIYRQDAV